MIIPAILTDSIQEVQDQLFRVKNETHLTRVQIDVVDPEFADNITIHPIDLIEVTTYNIDIDIHLMTNDPIDSVIECSHIPSIRRVIAQIERMTDQYEFCHVVSEHDLEPGLSLDLYTPIEELDETALSRVTIIQVMGNKAGKQGEQFAGSVVLEKIAALGELKREKSYPFEIAVDIGMTPETVSLCSKAGASLFMVGSVLWKSENLQTIIDEFSSNR